jgi:hypothetical protein
MQLIGGRGKGTAQGAVWPLRDGRVKGGQGVLSHGERLRTADRNLQDLCRTLRSIRVPLISFRSQSRKRPVAVGVRNP